MTAPLLEVQDLQVAFGGKPVVHGISFALVAGEKMALVGESGSGKTVTALALLRLLQGAQISGRVLWRGRHGEHADSDSVSGSDLLRMPECQLQAIRGDEIGFVFQEPMTALNPLMTVGHQIGEVLRLKRVLTPNQAANAAVELLAQMGIAEPDRRAKSYPHQLSGGQRQRAMIAMALACSPRLLLADEPTTALDVSLRGQILELLDEQRRVNRMAVLMITHDLQMVRHFADRVAVIAQGRIVEQGRAHALFNAPQHAYTRRLMASKPERHVLEASHSETERVLLKAAQLQVSYPIAKPGVRGWFQKDAFVAVQGADFKIVAGRTLGVIGESGSGKSTLAQAVLGLLPSQSVSGQLLLNGRPWRHRLTHDKPLRRVIQVVFQDPFSSLSPRMTIEEIVGEGLQVHAPHWDAAERVKRVRAALREVGLTETEFPALLTRYPHEFSGGQRQRIALARALIVEPALLVLDEPTSALDVTIQKQVLELLQHLQRERRLTYLLITHDVAVVRAMAHDILVLKDGQLVESGPIKQVFEQPQHPYTRALLAAGAPD